MSAAEFVDEITVRLADVGPGGRIRLEAVARYLQDLAHDHMLAVGLVGAGGWVLRRVEIEVSTLPRFGERLRAVTTCTAAGPRCANRVTRLSGDRGGAVGAYAIWVSVDSETGRSRALPDRFYDCFRLAPEQRRLSTRLRHSPPPPSVALRAWPTRAGDFDLNGHMNNAAFCAPLDDVVVDLDRDRIRRVELEYREAIQPDDPVCIALTLGPNELDLWLVVHGRPRASARIGLSSAVAP